MANIERYLYDDLSFTISTGIQPVIVNNIVIESKKAVPKVLWNINFGTMNMGLKNAIEDTIFMDPNNTTTTAYVGPHFYIGKRINPVGNITEYYLTYVFEYAYYNTFVNKPLAYVVDGLDHLIEGTLRIPISQVEGDTPISFPGGRALPRKLFHLASKVMVTHKFNNYFSMKVTFSELAAPLDFTNLFIAGVSYVDNNSSC